MVKGQHTGVADSHRTIESGSNAGIADIPAYPVERFPSCHKIDTKACRYAARPVFEFADIARFCHSGLILSAHATARRCLQDK
jgi:hypothetical protein